MRVLFVGDIVGRKARNFAQKNIVELKDHEPIREAKPSPGAESQFAVNSSF